MFTAACVTRAVAVVIFVPPEAPTTILILSCLSQMMEGHIDESALLPANSGHVTLLLFHITIMYKTFINKYYNVITILSEKELHVRMCSQMSIQ